MKNKFRFSYFWTIYFVLIVAFVCGLFWGANLLTDYLTAFEQSQPIHKAEEIFETYFSDDNFVPALEKAGYVSGEFEDLNAASRVLAEQKAGKEMSFYASTQSEGKICYNVVVTEEAEISEPLEEGQIAVQSIPSTKFATIYLVREETPDEFGLYGYEFERLEMFVKPEESVKITLPSTSKLLLGGKEVSADYIVEKAEHEFNAFLPQGVEGIQMVTYEVTGLYEAPTLSSTDKNGIAETLSLNEETGIYTAPLNYSEELKSAHAQRILTGMKEYAKYMQNDGSLGPVSQYFDTSSMFYRNIATNLSQFVWDHNGYEFQKEYIDEFYAFDESTFCCHVSFDHVLKLRGKEDYVDVVDMIIFVKQKGNAFYIYDRIVQ